MHLIVSDVTRPKPYTGAMAIANIVSVLDVGTLSMKWVNIEIIQSFLFRKDRVTCRNVRKNTMIWSNIGAKAATKRYAATANNSSIKVTMLSW